MKVILQRLQMWRHTFLWKKFHLSENIITTRIFSTSSTSKLSQWKRDDITRVPSKLIALYSCLPLTSTRFTYLLTYQYKSMSNKTSYESTSQVIKSKGNIRFKKPLIPDWASTLGLTIVSNLLKLTFIFILLFRNWIHFFHWYPTQ